MVVSVSEVEEEVQGQTAVGTAVTVEDEGEETGQVDSDNELIGYG